MSLSPPPRKTPRIVATGFTTAFLGDERTLREFIVGDHVRESIIASGENAILYLIVDNYDPLTDRQLRIGVDKKEKLIKQFEGYCGRPVAEVPDPFGCHGSYSDHFADALLKRLQALGIYPVMLDAYRAYCKGHYADFIETTFEHYSEIRDLLAKDFEHVAGSALFRAQCQKCRCMDATDVRKVENHAVQFCCKRCAIDWWEKVAEVRGKLSWKLDCAARWNLYGIDMEAFAKPHVAKLGTFAVSKFMSERWYGGKVPTVIKYGHVKISGDLSNHLIEILPPELLKRLFSSHLTSDLTLNREFVENFCHKALVRPGLTYTDYVRRRLPVEMLREENHRGPRAEARAVNDESNSDRELVVYGTRFAKFYYGREYKKQLHLQAFVSIDQSTAQTALRLIRHTLSVRNDESLDEEKVHLLIRLFVREQEACPKVYQLLRRVFGYEKGPPIPTLLTIISKDHLSTVELVLSFLARGVGAAAALRGVAANAASRAAPAESEEEPLTKAGMKP